MEQNKRNKLIIITITLAFLSPLIISWWVLNYTDYIQEGSKSNYGDLILPPVEIGDLDLIVPEEPDSYLKLKGKWNIVYVSESCDQQCVDNLYRMRQIHIAMDKNSLRIQRVLFLTSNQDQELKNLIKDYPRQRLVVNTNILSAELLNKFRLNDGLDPLRANKIYIIDPMGNLMMHYPPDINPRSIMKDLKKLLKASRIG